MQSASFFSADYVTARGQFREAVAAQGWELSSYPIDVRGPLGEQLTIDVAIGPDRDADRALVVSSGIHGVEGFVGSAIQLALLQEWSRRRDWPPAVRPILIHGLNPFGFGWRRRVNEVNVDLNRNLLLDGEKFSGSPPGGAELDHILNPKRPPSRWEFVPIKFASAMMRLGMPLLKEAIASGQYDFPQGLFFGGDRPSQMSEILAAHFDDWIGNARQVVHLDIHSGLGKWAQCRLLIDYPLTASQHERLSRWFGPDSYEVTNPNMTSYTLRGSLGRWCHSRFPGRDYLYAAAEYGTYRPMKMLSGLRAENQAHHWGDPNSPATERTKTRLVELFCPRSENWRQQVVGHSIQLVRRALDGLAEYNEAKSAIRRAS